LGISLQKNAELKYARIDGAGNIFIYPVDADDVLADIQEAISEYE
jgi:hypothetical protein